MWAAAAAVAAATVSAAVAPAVAPAVAGAACSLLGVLSRLALAASIFACSRLKSGLGAPSAAAVYKEPEHTDSGKSEHE
jgi:hypothetical protein